jgi:ABC-2 type transport system ATP-binding protein
MDEAEYCNRLGLIYRGELIALGTPHELKAETARGTEMAAGEVVDASDNDWRQASPSPPALPSLEDVFVARIEARDRAERPQQEVQR